MTELPEGHAIPGVEPFILERFGHVCEVSPCAGTEDTWHWVSVPHDHPETVQMPVPFAIDASTGQQLTREVPWQPVVIHLTTEQVLPNFTPDEARLFLGWCAHIREHLATHKLEIAKALSLAVEEGRDEGVAMLTAELHATNAMQSAVSGVAQTIYDGT